MKPSPISRAIGHEAGLVICLAGIVIVGFYSPIYEFINNNTFGIKLIKQI